MRILVIEDEKDLAGTLQESLQPDYEVDYALTAQDSLRSLGEYKYNLIILDMGLPDMNGLALCKKLRAEHVKIPILVLTGQAELTAKVQALDAGADDYITKPFSFAELAARIRALLRRNPESLKFVSYSIDNLTLNTETREVRRDGTIIELRRKQFELLEYFMRNAGRVLTRDMILEHVWDDQGEEPYSSTVDVHVKYLRDCIDKPFPKKLIKTIYGVGYKMLKE